jgi:hypothetical protein
MVKPGKKYNESYVLSELKGREILVIRSDDEYGQKAMIELDAKIRAENPEWTGTMLVLRTDQAIEKMPEPLAFALYKALEKCFASACTQCGSRTCEGTHTVSESEKAALVDANGKSLS